jgi:hypothetical protein
LILEYFSCVFIYFYFLFEEKIGRKEQTREWLSAHNYKKDVARDIYDHHEGSMQGNNSIGEKNEEQLEVLSTLQNEIEKYATEEESYNGYCIMLDAPGGTGKTFLVETIAAYCALNNYLCLTSAFSGVAAQLLPNGVTIHRRFGMVPGMDPEQNCNVSAESAKAAVLRAAKVLVLDEVTMMSKVDLERIDRTMQFLMENKKPFGGKVVILSGDFRQILPVEPKPIDSINTCLKKSYLWTDGVIKPVSLTVNERVRQFGGHESYATFLMYVGLGLLKTKKKTLVARFKEYTEDFIRLPSKVGDVEIVKKFENLEDFIDELFPNIGSRSGIPQSVVLTPKNKNMHVINSMCLKRYKPNEEHISLKSTDKPYIPEQEGFIPEDLLNGHNPGGLPPHDLQVKKGCYLMLLRNVNLYDGLANGTRCKLKDVSDSGKVIRVELLTGPKSNKDKYGNFIHNEKQREFPLFRIPNSNENDRTYKMIRKQFPVRLTYCMSINKSQGQTLKRVGLYLPNPVFSHGQLYVALSRVSRPENVTVFIDDSCDTHGIYRNKLYTKNFVYGQLLRGEIQKFTTGSQYMGEFPNFDDVEESEDEIDHYGRCCDFEEQEPQFSEPEIEEPELEEPGFEERDLTEPDCQEPELDEPDFEEPDFEEPQLHFGEEEVDGIDLEEPIFGDTDEVNIEPSNVADEEEPSF